MSAEPLIQDVSDTAFMVATCRAMENRRPDALFHDPLSEKLAGEHGKAIVKSITGGLLSDLGMKVRSRAMVWNMAIRTRIIDDFIREAVAQGADAIVNLGAGLDTRPYRMDLPPTLHWIEADFPKMIELKEKELAGEKPKCQLERAKLDLSQAAVRQAFLSELNSRFKNILVLTEGVVPYLTVEQAAELADDLRSRGSFKKWVVDYFSPETLKLRAKIGKRDMRNAPFRFEPKDYFGFFKEHGWKSKEMKYIWDEGQRLGRPLELPFLAKVVFGVKALFTSKNEKEAFKRFVAYVVFEPTQA
jgi:methyltransferase (TIGR00027 family)